MFSRLQRSVPLRDTQSTHTPRFGTEAMCAGKRCLVMLRRILGSVGLTVRTYQWRHCSVEHIVAADQANLIAGTKLVSEQNQRTSNEAEVLRTATDPPYIGKGQWTLIGGDKQLDRVSASSARAYRCEHTQATSSEEWKGRSAGPYFETSAVAHCAPSIRS